MDGKEDIEKLIVGINDIPKKYPEKKDGTHLFQWNSEIDYCKKRILTVIKRSFDESSYYIEELNRIPLPTSQRVYQDFARHNDSFSTSIFSLPPPGNFYYEFATPAINLLRVMESDLESSPIKTLDSDAVDLIHNICNKFYKVAEQLKKRHDGRESIKIKDEYDVQDLFHALLHLYFEDIRDEENMPSFAGISSRIDFLLEKEKIGIEIKKTGPNLKSDKLRTQLSEDIVSYEKHPGFNVLIFFVYDPEKLIDNPRGFEGDFNKENQDHVVRVFIRPTS